MVIVGTLVYSAAAENLRPEDAASRIGETATVCGVVASAMFEATVKDQPTLLDLGEPSPHAIFTAVIYGLIRASWPNSARRRGPS